MSLHRTQAIDLVNERMSAADHVFVIPTTLHLGTQKFTVKLKDGQYRKVSLVNGWEFMPARVYVGQRDAPILCLTPVDDLSFELLELTMPEIATVFSASGEQSFAIDLVRALQRPIPDGWMEAEADCLNELEIASLRDLLQEIEGLYKVAQKREGDYSAHPGYGLF